MATSQYRCKNAPNANVNQMALLQNLGASDKYSQTCALPRSLGLPTAQPGSRRMYTAGAGSTEIGYRYGGIQPAPSLPDR